MSFFLTNNVNTSFSRESLQYNIYTFAGTLAGGDTGEGVLATNAKINGGGISNYMTLDSNDNVYFYNTNTGKIRFIPSVSGTYYGVNMTANHIYSIFGNGSSVYSGDNGPATNAGIYIEGGIVVDSNGNIYAYGHNRIRFIPSISGTYYGQSMTAYYIYTIAGTGVNSYSGDGGPATSANIEYYGNLCVDNVGNIYFISILAYRVRFIPSVSGTYYGQSMTANYVYTIAGNGIYDPNAVLSGVPTNAPIRPARIAVDHFGNVYIALFNYRVVVLTSGKGWHTYSILTPNRFQFIAGTGVQGFNDGYNNVAQFGSISNIYVDRDGNVYISDTNNRIRFYSINRGIYYGVNMQANYVYTIAGDGSVVEGYVEGQPATEASLSFVNTLSISSTGDLYLMESPGRRISIIKSPLGPIYYNNSGGVIMDKNMLSDTITGYKMSRNCLYTIAGNGSLGYSGDGGPATGASFSNLTRIAVDSYGNIYSADRDNSNYGIIRFMPASSGTYYGISMTANFIYTIIGPSAPINNYNLSTDIRSICIDPVGNIYIADYGNRSILFIPSVSGTYYGISMTANLISVIAGGTGSYVDGGLATDISFSPASMCVDYSVGNIYVYTNLSRILFIPTAAGTYYGVSMTANRLYSIAGNGSNVFSGDNGLAINAGFSGFNATMFYTGICIDKVRNIYILAGNRIRFIPSISGTFFGVSRTANYIYTLTGDGIAGNTGDGGPATSARIIALDIFVNSFGNIYMAENNTIRFIPALTASYLGTSITRGNIYRLAGNYSISVLGTTPSKNNTFATDALVSPSSICVDSGNNIYFINQSVNPGVTAYKICVIHLSTKQLAYLGGSRTTANHIYTIAGPPGPPSIASDDHDISATHSGVRGNIYVDSAGNIYCISDNGTQIKFIPKSGGFFFGVNMRASFIYNIAGVYRTTGYSGDGLPAINSLVEIGDIHVDSSGNIYCIGGNRIRFIPSISGTYYGQNMIAYFIYTIAGTGSSGFGGDGGPAISATFNSLIYIHVDSTRNIYMSDNTNHRIRFIPLISGTYYGQSMTANYVYTIAGNGVGGYSGDGGLATNASICQPRSIYVDSAKNIYLIHQTNTTSYQITHIRFIPAVSGAYHGVSNMTANYIYTIAGNTSGNSAGEGVSPTSIQLYLQDMSVDASGNIYLLDNTYQSIRFIPYLSGTYYEILMDANKIYTISGGNLVNGSYYGYSGENGPASGAMFSTLLSIFLDSYRNIYVVDDNGVLRVISSGKSSSLDLYTYSNPETYSNNFNLPNSGYFINNKDAFFYGSNYLSRSP
jgi:hypothetical protein